MNTIKKLPLTMAVIAALCPISVLAQEFTQEQIDAIVAKAVDKALAERQAKMDAAVAKKADVVTEPQSAATVLKFTSSKDGGLGDQLPAGTVRVYMKDAKGDPQFIGENAIPHTPMGSELAIRTGEAFDVKVKSVVTERTRLGDRRWRTAMRYTLTNARPDGVTVDLIQDGLDWYWSDTRIIAESQKSERPSSNTAQWKVAVPANGEAELTATFETRF